MQPCVNWCINQFYNSLEKLSNFWTQIRAIIDWLTVLTWYHICYSCGSCGGCCCGGGGCGGSGGGCGCCSCFKKAINFLD